jgi:Tol biopolymer transport system component
MFQRGSAVLLALSAVCVTNALAATAPKKVITVSEVTNTQVTVSPDHKTILADIQGLIYSLPIAGGPAKQLTQPLQEASHPDWSAKGDIVAIQSYTGGTFHIWTMKPDGTGLKQVTTGHGDDREPRISPDGTTIVFTSDRAFEGSYDIYTVPITGGEPRRITSSPADEFGPSWSPDGKSIVFISGVATAGSSIESIDLATGKQTQLRKTSAPSKRFEAPSWSPDGKQLAYMEFEGTDVRQLDTAHLNISGDKPFTGKADDAYPFPAIWLNNHELLYTGDGHIFRVDLTTGAEKPIPLTAGIPSIRPVYKHKLYDFDSTAPRPVLGIYTPTLSPDGKSVAFIALNQLYSMPIGGKPVAITNDLYYKQGATWSPNGKWIAYVSDRDGIENIYLHDVSKADASTDRRIAPSQTAQIMPSWSFDGKRIAFQDQAGATLIADVATGKTTPLAPATFFPGRPAFSTNGKTVSIATIKPYTKRYREGTSSILAVDVATGKQQWFAPAPFESITTRTEDGPVYAPNGKEMAFVMDDLLYTMPVDADGHPTGPAVKLNDEITDAPSYSGDSSKILYESVGKLHLIDRATGAITPVPLDMTYTVDKPGGTLLIHAGRFWKGTGSIEQKNVDVLITNNRITSVKPHSAVNAKGVGKVIEAPDSTVLPGLWENHAHPDSDNGIYYGARFGKLWLAYGITTTRGIADNAYRAKEHVESYRSGTAMGPRLFDTAEAVDGERVYYPMMIATTSEAQLQREFTRIKGLDFDMVKLYVRLPFAWAAKGIDFAHNQMGVDTASHYLLPAVALGEDGMSHISATARTGWAYSRSLTGRSYGDVHKLLVDSGMWTISTTFAQAQYSEDPGMATDPRQAIAPPWENTRLKAAVTLASTTNMTAGFKHLELEEHTVADDFRKGGIILAGTDSPLDIPATSLHLNLRAQVKYGMAPWQALETATSMAAKAYGLGKDLGTLEPGKLADLIIVSGDPLTNISDVTKVQCVVTNGRLHSLHEIGEPFANLAENNVCPSKP